MSRAKYYVNDKSRMCRVVSGPGMAEEAEEDGFRLVSPTELDVFRVVTKNALDAGWKPKRLSYDAFISKHPVLVS